jgi:hypothetical protein
MPRREFADRYYFGGRRGELQQLGGYQVVVQNDIRPTYQPIAFDGYQLDIARPGAHEIYFCF